MRQAHSVFGESHVAEFASSPDRPQNTLLRWLSRATCCLAACSLALLAACGGGRNDADLSHGRSSAMNSGTYGLPSKAPTSESAPPPEKWSSYFTEKASSDPYGLIGKEGARAKAAASGFVPGTAHRFYNTASGVHFYTLSEQERLWVQANLPHFTYEGQGFFAVPTQVDELSPVYRFYNLRTGSHFYTISSSERDHVIATLSVVFKYEGIAWYGSTVPGPGWFPMYRFFNTATGTHFYTATPAERDNVRNTLPTFNYEGIAYYVRLSGELDGTLTGSDANGNGVRDSVEQVLSRLIPDPTVRQTNVTAARVYEQILSDPLPSTRDQAMTQVSSMSCADAAAGAQLYDRYGQGLNQVIFDTDQRYQRLEAFREVLDGGYFGSELSQCPSIRALAQGTARTKSGRSISGSNVRVVFVNGIQNPETVAIESANALAATVKEADANSNFDYDFQYNPSLRWAGLPRDVNELRAQSLLSNAARESSGHSWSNIRTIASARIDYYRALGDIYSSPLPPASAPISPFLLSSVAKTAEMIAAYVKQLVAGDIRVVLVPHSQGNFYVEAALGLLVREIETGLWPDASIQSLFESIRVVSVGPVASTSWNNTHVRSTADSAIEAGMSDLVAPEGFSILPSNFAPCVTNDCKQGTSIDSVATLTNTATMDILGHGFSETYLNASIYPALPWPMALRNSNQSIRAIVGKLVQQQINHPTIDSLDPPLVQANSTTSLTVRGTNLVYNQPTLAPLTETCSPEAVSRTATQLIQNCRSGPQSGQWGLRLGYLNALNNWDYSQLFVVNVTDFAPSVSSIIPGQAQLNVATTFVVNGQFLPPSATLSIPNTNCDPPVWASSNSFSQRCTVLGSTGSRPVTVYNDSPSVGGQVIDSSHVFQVVSQPAGLTNRLPHTGITSNHCYQVGTDELVPCNSPEAINLSGAGKQDGMQAHINSMSYTKIGFNGEALSNNASSWCAVLDNVTGLMWENHQTPPGTFSNWGDNRVGDASHYASQNSFLCGLAEWRLPTLHELESLVDVTRPWPGPSINGTFFPNTRNGTNNGTYVYPGYWSLTPVVVSGNCPLTWIVYFGSGYVGLDCRYYSHAVRLVRTYQ